MKRKHITIAATCLGIACIACLAVSTATLSARVSALELEQRQMAREHAREAIIAAQASEPDVIDEVIVEAENEPQNGDFVNTPTDISVGWTQESLGDFRITYYCPCEKCCGEYANGITASGAPCVEGVTCACDCLPIGTRVNVDGAIYTVEDRFGSFDGSHRIDIYVDSHERALALGTHTSEVFEIIFEEADLDV